MLSFLFWLETCKSPEYLTQTYLKTALRSVHRKSTVTVFIQSQMAWYKCCSFLGSVLYSLLSILIFFPFGTADEYVSFSHGFCSSVLHWVGCQLCQLSVVFGIPLLVQVSLRLHFFLIKAKEEQKNPNPEDHWKSLHVAVAPFSDSPVSGLPHTTNWWINCRHKYSSAAGGPWAVLRKRLTHWPSLQFPTPSPNKEFETSRPSENAPLWLHVTARQDIAIVCIFPV